MIKQALTGYFGQVDNEQVRDIGCVGDLSQLLFISKLLDINLEEAKRLLQEELDEHNSLGKSLSTDELNKYLKK